MRVPRLVWLTAAIVTGAIGAMALGVMAAPVPQAPVVKDRKQLKAESRRFAQQVNRIIAQILDNYVRPLRREDLMETAIRALYQAAHARAPIDLRNRVRQATSMSSLLQVNLPSPDDPPQRKEDLCENLLAEMREKLGNAEGLTNNQAVVICCKAIAKLLDPYSGVVTAEEQQRSIGLDEETFGAGLQIRDALSITGPAAIESVQLGSPAQRAGLRPGDVITHIDGAPLSKATPEKLLVLSNQRILASLAPLTPGEAEQGVPVELSSTFRMTYHRAGEKDAREVTVLRERFRPETVLGSRRRDDNSWDYVLDEKQHIAHVRLTSLSKGTSDDLRAVLAALTYKKVRGIILDLRWCPGGYLDESVYAAMMFLGNVTISTVKSRGREDLPYRGAAQGAFSELNLVVLVNGETSGGAELVAAALQDHHRAVVVGQRTRGKASVQTQVSTYISGIGFKLTSGAFWRPSGKNLHKSPESTAKDDWGVIPDEDARISAELSKKLGEWWKVYSLRPARSMERLELDDPRADPQRQAALAVMRKRLAK